MKFQIEASLKNFIIYVFRVMWQIIILDVNDKH